MGYFTRSQPVLSGINGPAQSILAQGETYVTLDGLRGLAALAVALFHLDATLMPGGYLAVDFFFALSGFVLIRTYEPRFDKGMAVRQFMLIRGIRLYPLYAVGIIFGIAFAFQGLLRGSEGHLPVSEFLGGSVLNLIMLPSTFSRGLFPMNPPAWSLFFEVLANLALVTFMTKMRTFSLIILALLTGIILGLAAWHFQDTTGGQHLLHEGEAATSAGANWDGWYVGIIRAAFSFTAGMVIVRAPTKLERPVKTEAALSS